MNNEQSESNLTMQNNPFIDQEMNFETTMKNDETSETSIGTQEKKNSEKFYMPEQYMMMNDAGFDDNFKKNFWCEAVSTATKTGQHYGQTNGRKTSLLHVFQRRPKIQKICQNFGEIAVVANHERKSTRTKIKQRGKETMFVEFADDHIGDVYRFIHLNTQYVILSRDARWMNIMWRAYMRKQQCINCGLQIIDEDFEPADDDEIQENCIRGLTKSNKSFT